MDIKKLTVNQNQTIKNTMKTIDQNSLGLSFIVDDQNKLVGVATDGDIRRAVLKGLNLKEKIKKIMTKNPVTVKKGWTEEKIKHLLKQKDVKRKTPTHGTIKIPVVNKKNEIIDLIFASKNQIETFSKNKNTQNNKTHAINNILIVGGAGYLGSILSRKLLEKNYHVRVLDNLTYGDHGIKELYDHPRFEFIKGDMRNIQTLVEAVKNIDSVIHLAALVGDPASAINPEETIQINYLATKTLAEVCKYSQINRFIFASTCSVYGASPTPETKIEENSQLNPVSLYAEMKLKSEEALFEISDENFKPTILRMATLYGLSPRMRFDLVVNILSIKALKEKEFTIFGGKQWRPLLHIKDAADAYIECLENPLSTSGKQIFNVGSNHENYQIIDVGKTVKEIMPQAEMKIDKQNVDERNYNVSFDKIHKTLDYTTMFSIDDGIKEIKKAVMDENKFTDYPNQVYNNYSFLKNNSNH
ncbi:MAG: NAD-dependent epimerase/dehydratase family protein [Candidatus Thermoplasmatota archaeon]